MITRGAVVQGGTSLGYKTGSWRDERPVIDREKCQACGICRQVCPDDAVRTDGDIHVINYDYCKGCGICAYECKFEAIEMVQEEK
jgi:pyruvate ferredoxin oxidoreductase delta subunit